MVALTLFFTRITIPGQEDSNEHPQDNFLCKSNNNKQEAHESWFANLSKTAIAYLQMPGYILQVLPSGCYTMLCLSGPSCSKLTMSLVNDSLKFTSNDTQIC